MRAAGTAIQAAILTDRKKISVGATEAALHSHLDALAAAIETPLLAYPNVELLLVMVVAPVLLNAVFF